MSGKVLITGASGWLGKCTVKVLSEYLHKSVDDLILFSSASKEIKIEGISYKTHSLLNTNIDFQNIEGIVHLAFLTRDKMNAIGFKDYVSTNIKITEAFEKIVSQVQPKWVTTVSSGAAHIDSGVIESNPYGYLKIREELRLQEMSKEFKFNYSIGRLWGAMGFDMPINRNYAISDFICQALIQKQITVNAQKLVFRRYVSDLEFMETCIKGAINGVNSIFDSGGDKIEVRALAQKVANALNVEKIITSDPTDESDDYYPKNEIYAEIRGKLNLPEPEGLNTLVKETIEGHKSQQLR